MDVQGGYITTLLIKDKSIPNNQRKPIKIYNTKDLPVLKKSENKLVERVNSQSLQTSLENLDKALQSSLEIKGFPKFKSKHDNRQSFSVPQNGIVDFETNTISLPKFKKPIKCKLHRRFEGNSKTVYHKVKLQQESILYLFW